MSPANAFVRHRFFRAARLRAVVSLCERRNGLLADVACRDVTDRLDEIAVSCGLSRGGIVPSHPSFCIRIVDVLECVMGVGELIVILILLLVSIVVPVGVTVAMWIWGTNLSVRHGGKWWPRARWLPIVGGGLLGVGLILTVVSLLHGFSSVSDVDPSQKAELLAKGISESINYAAFVTVPGQLLYLCAIVLFLVGTIRKSPTK